MAIMTGVVQGLAPCWLCGRIFAFHPLRVPSIPIDPETGKPPDVNPKPGGYGRADRKPLCESCVGRINVRRRQLGEPEVEILPGAYDAADESVLYS